MASTRRRIGTVAAAALLTVGMTGCGKAVDSGDVEKELSGALEKQSQGAKVGEASCKDDLKAEVGETTDCDVDIDGKKQKFKAKVTSVNDDKVRFNFTRG